MSLPSRNERKNKAGNFTSYLKIVKLFSKKCFLYIKEKTVILLNKAYEKLSYYGGIAKEHTLIFCDFTGDVTSVELNRWYIFAKKCAIFLKKVFVPKTKKVVSFCKKTYKKTEKLLSGPISKAKKVIPFIKEHFKNGGFKNFFNVLKHRLKTDSHFRTNFINYLSPIAGVFVFVFVVSVSSNITYALSIEQNGQVVAYVADESIYTEAKNDLQTRLVSDTEESLLELDPQFSIVSVSKRKISEPTQVTDNLIRMSDEDIVEADGLYVDDVFYGAVTNDTLIQSIFDETLDKYRSEEGTEKVEFAKKVELKKGYYLADSVVSDSEMRELLTSDVKGKRTYTIKSGDSPSLIASKHGIPYATFKALNPTLEQKCMIGDEAVISNNEPFLSVKVTKEENYIESVPYKIETTNDSSKEVGYTKVVQEGKAGSREVRAMVEYIDNVEESRQIIYSNTLEEPVTKKVIKGTKVTYSSGSSYSSGSGKVSGNFIWPVGGSGGRISCYYGSRGHRGLDIAAPYGTPIRASASGRVVVSGWYYSYGKCVVIDHGNGVRTLYGHNSSLNVSVGDYVSQGQKIAGCGSTGYSTGNHLHFEVIVNGANRNPSKYL